MRLSEITTDNKPYIKISKGNKKVEVPIIPKPVVLPAGKINMKKYSYVGCQKICVRFKGKIVRLNWAFNHNRISLLCSADRKAYCWKNIKVVTINGSNGTKEQIVVCKRDFGDETERRKFKRYSTKKPVTIRQAGNCYKAATADVSIAGIGIIVEKNVQILPKIPIEITFSDESKINARMVRTVFREDGSELLGCRVSKSFRYQMTRFVRIEEDFLERQRHGEGTDEFDTDEGWLEGSIKRWQ